MNRLSAYLTQHLTARLAESRILVWYDSEQAFGEFVASLQVNGVTLVNAASSLLTARRQAEDAYRALGHMRQLLIYLPHARPADGDARTRAPFEAYAVIGAVFGEAEHERLIALARAAAPELAAKIDDLALSGTLTFELLDRLQPEATYVRLEGVVGKQSPAELCARLLADAATLTALDQNAGAKSELLTLLEHELGFAPRGAKPTLKVVREQLAQFVLLSELAFDLPNETPWPTALAPFARADFAHRDTVYAICDRLRHDTEHREAYLGLANQLETELHLADHFRGLTRLGARDTFAFEEHLYLSALVRAVQANDLAAARTILTDRQNSLWRAQPGRAQLWRLVERSVAVLEAAQRAQATDLTRFTVRHFVEAYVSTTYRLDQTQRLLEQAAAEQSDLDEVQPALDLARQRYLAAALHWQTAFLKQVQTNGWPAEGLTRQTQVFDQFVKPALDRHEKVAYFLADSLRFEMGQALADDLRSLGTVTLTPVSAALPTMTPNGMAALLPGADGALSLHRSGAEYVPHLGGQPLKDSTARMAYLTGRYGNLFTETTLDYWLSVNDKKRAALSDAQLLVIRAGEIDELGEHVTLRQARKHMSALLGELKAAAAQVARLGFQHLIIVADHGHMLLPEILSGDIAPTPAGDWALSKRRLRLGARHATTGGTLFFAANQLGLQTDLPDYVVPSGFGVYAADAHYFHEGLSLPECVLPVIAVQLANPSASVDNTLEVKLLYGKDRFTSQVIGLKVDYRSSTLFGEPLVIRLQAFDVANLKGAPVGEAADCPARDENTHEVTLRPNEQTDVPLLIAHGFTGNAIEIRATAPDNPTRIFAHLRLKNGVLD